MKKIGLIFVLLLIMLTACSSPTSIIDEPEAVAAEEVFLNERLRLVYPAKSGVAKLFINDNEVENALFGASSVTFDLNLDALGGTFQDKALVKVSIAGTTVLEQELHVVDNTLASSDFVLFTKGFNEAELEAELNNINTSRGLAEGFSVRKGSFQQIEDTTKSDAAIALLSLGEQASDEALGNLNTLSLALQQSATKSLAASPNLLYGISMRPRYWSSPRCDVLSDLQVYADDSWKLLKTKEILDIIGASKAHEADLKGGGVSIPILDTGINAGDTYDCADTVFVEGHGTHVFKLADLVAPEASMTAKLACTFEGFCSTAEIAKALIDLENDVLVTEKKVIVNLSLTGSVGIDDQYDRAIWTQLNDYQNRYPNFLAVAAAGNHGISDDTLVSTSLGYPASFSDIAPQAEGFTALKNVISVGTVGVDAITNKLIFTELNPKNAPLDLVAPGIRLCLENQDGNCEPDNRTTGLSGSSFATALVSGVAAILWAECPSLSAIELKQLLKNQARSIEGTSYKLVNADPSFTLQCETTQETPAPVITSFEANPNSILAGQSSILSWTVTGTPDTILRIDPDIGVVTGDSLTVTPNVRTTYILSASNSQGSDSKQASIIVDTGDPNRLDAGTERSGNLTTGTTLNYSFLGFKNTPLLFTLDRSDELLITAGVYSLINGVETKLKDAFETENQTPFTAQESGEYILKVEATLGAGNYTLRNQYVAGPPSSRNIEPVINFDQTLTGTLADGAFDTYRITPAENTNVIFYLDTTNGMTTLLSVEDPDKNVLESPFSTSGRYPLLLEANKEYYMGIYAGGGPGDYTFIVEKQ